MKIAICGSQSCGKSTLIKAFKERWPMYKSPEITYRDILEKNPKINQEGDAETQKKILEALVEESKLARDDAFVIFDRCALDNLVYSLWLNAYEKVTDDFITNTKYTTLEALKEYDIIFYLPLRKEIPIVERENRDSDPVYREEVDNIFKAVIKTYENGDRSFFPVDRCPAVITLEGPPDLRIHQIALYIKESGKCFDESDGSLIS